MAIGSSKNKIAERQRRLKMNKVHRLVAFIPLRAKSKTIPLKNIKKIAGKPLAFWVIFAALKCPLIGRVIVSTDSDLIRNTIKKIKNKKLKIIGRSPETATDKATTESAMLEFAENNDWFEHIVQTHHLTEGIKKYFKNKYDSLLSVVRQRRFIWEEKNEKARPVNYNPLKRKRMQDLEGFLVENGAFYITSREKLLKTKYRLSGKMGVYEMPEYAYFELDELSDWVIMEHFLKAKKGQLR
jgi:N-acylneuraminate cytidylyltransferase